MNSHVVRSTMPPAQLRDVFLFQPLLPVIDCENLGLEEKN